MSDISLIPREVLFGNPTRVSPRISPDGRRLAWIAPHEGVLNVWVQTIGGDDERVVTDDRDRGIRAFFWSKDNRRILYVQDQAGDENWRIYGTDLESGTTTDLTPFDGVQARVNHVSKHRPTEILVDLNRDNEQLHDTYLLDLESNELTKVAENPGFIAMIADDTYAVRGALAPTPDGGMAIVGRQSDDAEWAPLLQVPQEDALSTQPIGFDQDGKRMLAITSADANTARLVWIDLASGERTVVAEDPVYDVAAARLHPDTKEIEAVGFLKDRLVWEVLDHDAVGADFEALSAVDDGDLALQGHDDSDRTWLVAFDHDDGPVRYYSYDRDTRQAEFMFVHRPELEDYTLATMEPFSFEASDGLTIHGYVTFPPGSERSSEPLVLNVHGGPWARDSWGHDPEAQWLANRGYAVAQVNFRGSTGYGKKFVSAGDKEWAGKMHTDLLEAVEHLAAKGWIDRDRVAIYGGSYGGYAALVGATFTPDFFTCAIDIVGPSNLETLIRSIPPYWAPMIAQFHTRVGNPDDEADKKDMWARSPLSKVDQIKIPMLIAQGANDPRVKQAESEQIVAAMQEKGIPHEYLLYEDEGHGFAKPENRLHFYAAAEKFLAAHLGGRFEA